MTAKRMISGEVLKYRKGERWVIRPGYADGHWTTASYTDQGIRHKLGACHWPLPELLHMVMAAGLELEWFAEGGRPVPLVLALRARKHG